MNSDKRSRENKNVRNALFSQQPDNMHNHPQSVFGAFHLLPLTSYLHNPSYRRREPGLHLLQKRNLARVIQLVLHHPVQ